MAFNFKNKLIKSILIVLVFFISHVQGRAQLVVNSAMTPQELVENILLGTGVTVYNITYSGTNNARGHFSGNTNLGLQSGVLLTSGEVSVAVGPNNSGSDGVNNQINGDPDLTAISSLYSPSGNPIDTWDACILEFDFIPQSDTIKFRYIFASEEYHEYSNSTVNDVFAFFISGPGITGPYSSPPAFPGGSINIALVPGTTTGVSINTVNNGINNTGPCLNCQYFLHNSQNSIQYDAWTTILTATAVVIPCITYHIKLAIADGGDHIFDSGVFLEENSFSADAIEIETTYTNAHIDTNAIEGCNNAIISFVLPKPTQSGYIIPIVIGGTAPNNGSDYPVVTTNVFIPASQDSTAIEIIPYYDSIQEGTEYVQIIYPKSICLTDYDTIIIQIRDNMPMMPVASNDTSIICGDTANLIVVDSGGIAPYTYTWSTGDTVPSIFVSPTIMTDFYINVTDVCDTSYTDTVRVSIIVPHFANAGNDTSICFGESVNLSASGGNSYLWSTGDITPTIMVTPIDTTIYYVTVTQVCSDIDTVIVNVNPLPLVIATSNNDSICVGDSTILDVSGAYTYLWSSDPPDPTLVGQETFPNPITKPMLNTIYYVTGTDINGCVDTSMTEIFINPIPSSAFSVSNKSLCEGENTSITFTGMASSDAVFKWDFSNGVFTGSGEGPYEVFWVTTGVYLIRLQVSDKGCLSPISTDTVIVHPLPVVDFSADITEGCPPLKVNFTDNSTNVISTATFIWEFGDGAKSLEKDPEYFYFNPGTYSITHTVINQDGCIGTRTIDDMITVYPVPKAGLYTEPDEVSIFYPLINFYDDSEGDGLTYLWDLGDGHSSTLPEFLHTYNDTGTYIISLIVINSYGCVDSITGKIEVRPDYTIYLPNAFTPNADGSNDIFRAYSVNILEFDLSVFNRWGMKLFQTHDQEDGWDGYYKGKIAPGGTYVYVLYYRDALGNYHHKYGHFLLVR